MSTEVFSHGALVKDLRNWLQGDDFVCSEVAFGSKYLTNARIPDVMRVRKSYTRWDVGIYEVKVNRSDFTGEIRNGKWLEYLPMSRRFYFATPADGVVHDKSEIPVGAGWIVRGPNGWSVKKTPTIREFEPNCDQLLALLMSVEKDRKSALCELEAVRKSKHVHNVKASSRMWRRVYAVETELRDKRSTLNKLRDARSRFEKVTGLKMEGYDWLEKLESRMSVGGVHLDSVERFRDSMVYQLNQLCCDLPQVGDNPVVGVRKVLRGDLPGGVQSGGFAR